MRLRGRALKAASPLDLATAAESIDPAVGYRSRGCRERCLWCGELGADLQSLPHRAEYNGVLVPTHSPIRACEVHAAQVQAYLTTLAKRSGYVLATRLVGAALVVIGGIADAMIVVAVGAVVLGSSVLMLPYSSVEAVRRFGVLRAQWIARFIGASVLAVAIGGLLYLLMSG